MLIAVKLNAELPLFVNVTIALSLTNHTFNISACGEDITTVTKIRGKTFDAIRRSTTRYKTIVKISINVKETNSQRFLIWFGPLTPSLVGLL